MDLTVTEILLRTALGVLAGAVGGLAGLGGSIIMLPALAMIWGYTDANKTRHHVYMAAAMFVNVLVALSSSFLHQKKGAARKDLLIVLIPTMALGMIGGVVLSGESKGEWSLYAFAGFIWLYCAYNIVTTIRKIPDYSDDSPTPSAWKILLIGFGTGIVSGYLGIGGGILLVPLLQMAKLPLRHAIAGSAGAMWISSIIGASMKLYTLPSIHTEQGVALTISDAMSFAIPMGVGAIVGAYLGAMLTHKLKLPHLKLTIAVILAIASVRMVMK